MESSPLTIVKPDTGWKGYRWRELWRYRELLLAFCLRDIKVRYKQTVLGAVWAVLQPLLTMLIFTVIFGRLAGIPSDGMPYPVFVYAGLLPWMFFAAVVSNCAMSMVGASHMLSKIYYPRLITPVSAVGGPTVDFFVSTVVLLLLMAWFDVPWSWGLLLLPFLLLGLGLVALGVGIFMSSLIVRYRDFRYVVPFMVQTWMYLTPVVYPLSFIPESWRWLLMLNPVTGIVSGFRSVFLGTPVDTLAITVGLVLSILLFLGGVRYFRSVERAFADII